MRSNLSITVPPSVDILNILDFRLTIDLNTDRIGSFATVIEPFVPDIVMDET